MSYKNNFAKEKVIGIFIAYNPNRWSPSKIKDIDVLFIGQVGSYRSIRQKYLNAIKGFESKYKVVISILERNNFISWDEYISLSRRSKIIVNFSQSIDFDQLKGRVFEAMNCGAVLIEYIKSPIFSYFDENIHFVAFRDEKELINQIDLLLSNPIKCANIRHEAEAFLKKNFSSKLYWSLLLRN